MKKLIINSIMVVIITTLILLATYGFAYEILIIKSEVETMKSIDENKLYPKEVNQVKYMCDGCAEYKDNLKQVKLQDIPQPVLLCEECQLKFKEVNND